MYLLSAVSIYPTDNGLGGDMTLCVLCPKAATNNARKHASKNGVIAPTAVWICCMAALEHIAAGQKDIV
jgi:hypothetical protein